MAKTTAVQTSSYLIFHANLAFSAIEKEEIATVIDRVYQPLLDLVEQQKFIKIGFEINGFSLEILNRKSPNWIRQFKSLLKLGKVELLASGYMQIIGPIVPYRVNFENQKIGIKVYKKILGVEPRIAYVNEQVLSSSIIDLYSEFGFSAIIAEWNNVFSQNSDKIEKCHGSQPIYLKGLKSKLPVIWSDSLIFQKFQRVIHNELNYIDYFDFLDNYLDNKTKFFAAYSSDLEIFNYRPGRFSTEKDILFDEWQRVYLLIRDIACKYPIVLPSDTLDYILPLEVYPFTSKNPILVKKQDKYSLSRWSACGWDSVYINTLCFRFLNSLNKKASEKKWKKLLQYWGSDYRTHTTKKKWKMANKYLEKNTIAPRTTQPKLQTIGAPPRQFIINERELIFEWDDLKINFNLQKGLALSQLTSGGIKHPVATIPHGTFSNVGYMADFFTGSSVLSSAEHGNLSDLKIVENLECMQICENQFSAGCELRLKTLGTIRKIWTIDISKRKLSLQTNIALSGPFPGSIRLGTLTLCHGGNKPWYETYNGGKYPERFIINDVINHQAPISLHQSSATGIGFCENGVIKFGDESTFNDVEVAIDLNQGYPFTMIQAYNENKVSMTRLFFSVQEIDDTSRSLGFKLSKYQEKCVKWTINF